MKQKDPAKKQKINEKEKGALQISCKCILFVEHQKNHQNKFLSGKCVICRVSFIFQSHRQKSSKKKKTVQKQSSNTEENTFFSDSQRSTYGNFLSKFGISPYLILGTRSEIQKVKFIFLFRPVGGALHILLQVYLTPPHGWTVIDWLFFELVFGSRAYHA